MTTFVLVHGGYHGGWCWSRVVDALTARGHLAIAPDLPIDDVAAGYEEYAAAVLDAMTDVAAGEDIVLVGHSLGCYITPMVAAALIAANRPVRQLFSFCAVPAATNEALALDATSILTDELIAVTYFADAEGRTMQTPASFINLFYRDVDPADTAWALARLRPLGPRVMTDPWPLDALPDVPHTIVLARDDNVVRFEAGLVAAKALTGNDPIVVPGGHSVFLTDPNGLADILLPGWPIR
jgi:pimeloyl-ACP methyl ester carboxylesterase